MIGRVALHAYRLEYEDPFEDNKVRIFEADLPSDMQDVISKMT